MCKHGAIKWRRRRETTLWSVSLQKYIFWKRAETVEALEGVFSFLIFKNSRVLVKSVLFSGAQMNEHRHSLETKP